MTHLTIVLDDELEITRILDKALREEGFEVICCHSMQSFKEKFEENAADLAFVDLGLPDGNGLEVARWVKEESDAGVIILTGRGDEIDRVLGLELGADDYIVKPFGIRELRARAKAVLRRVLAARQPVQDTPAPASNNVQVLHGLTISYESRVVRDESGQEIELTTLEFDVLCVLAARPNRVFSRDQIMDNVRGPDWAAYDRSVDGLISRLRRKLFTDGSGTNKIKTIRGVGYMLVGDR
ncbi:MAG: response regulator transcription factor [Roseovarius sp.]|jgi:DNA-binding response OmpR family regulator|uniref:response regulator transcription factor n=1 Tax=Roseovarius sp. TaxID=1486281 RepID=UPI0032EB9720